MENLKLLSSADLLNKTRSLTAEERRITLDLIDHLREVDRRMLYAELGFGSLFEFTVKYLGFSEGSAHRRISAMRLLHDVPSAKEKIESGELTVTNAAKIQVALKSRDQTQLKTELVETCLNLSQKECEAVLFQKVPELSKSLLEERVRRVTSEKTEIKLLISEELLQKIEKLNRIISHSNPEQKILILFERLVDQELKTQEKKASVSTNTRSTTGQNKTLQSDKFTRLRSIPIAVQKQILSRANGRCEFKGCTSNYQLQIDHIRPKALGGDHSLENLRVLCRTHNLYEAKRILGDRKINSLLVNR